MALSFQCGKCGKKLTAREELAGKKVKCPGCGAVVVAPPAETIPLEESASPPRPRMPIRDPEPAAKPSDRTPPPAAGGGKKLGLFIGIAAVVLILAGVVVYFTMIRKPAQPTSGQQQQQQQAKQQQQPPPIVATKPSPETTAPKTTPVAPPSAKVSSKILGELKPEIRTTPVTKLEIVPASTVIPIIGLEKAKFGMKQDEVIAALGQPTGTIPGWGQICYPGFKLQIRDGNVEDVIIEEPGTKTTGGIRVGDSAEQVLLKYGKLEEGYRDRGVIMQATYFEFGLTFRFEGNKVKTIQAYRIPRRILAPPPLDSLGGIWFGMGRSELIRTLGDPGADNVGTYFEYPDRGFRVEIGIAGLHEIEMKTEEEFNPQDVLCFRGHTAEGLGLGATEQQITAAYGDPDFVKLHYPTMKSRHLCYWKRLLEFHTEDGKTVKIVAKSPSERQELTPVPVVGAEKLSFGMMPPDVVAILGKPDKIAGEKRYPSPVYYLYYAAGMNLNFDRWRGLTRVDFLSKAWWPPRMESTMEGTHDKTIDFRGRTDERIGLGSTVDEVKGAYGYNNGYLGLHNNWPAPNSSTAVCEGKRLVFVFLNGKVAHFSAFAPGNMQFLNIWQ